MAKTYTVKWGDTLWSIAKENNTTYQTLAKINNLDIIKKNGQDYVHLTVGQVIKLVDDGSSSNSTKVTSDKVKIKTFGLQSNSDRGMYVTWNWDRENTKEYKVEWYDYYDGYFHKSENTVTVKNSEFTANGEASKVKVKIKPVAKTYENSKGKEVAYWTNVNWATSDDYFFSDNPPKKPTSAPKIEIDNTKLTATLEGLSNLNSPSIIEFQLGKDEVSTSTTVKAAAGNKISVSAEFKIAIGSSYRVRARTIRGLLSSAWSEWSESKSTIPAAPEITKCVSGASDNTVELTWTSVATAKSYEIQYTENQSYFDHPTDNQPYSITDLTEEQIKTCKAIISSNIVDEKNFYFRIRAKNDVGDSAWSNISQFNTGDGPASPTTFSSRSSLTVGELVTLNWTHNSKSNAKAKYSHLDIYVDGVKKPLPVIDHDTGEDATNEKSYTINTVSESSGSDEGDSEVVCPDGAQLQWRVRTAGEDGFLGEWSVLRTINVYSRPELTFNAYDATDDELISPFTLTTLPLKLRGFVDIDPLKQKIIGYHISIVANSTHQVVNNYGETVVVYAGDTVYERPFDVVDPVSPNYFEIDISAGDVTFANDTSYTVTCTVAMDSGLSVSKTISFAAVLTKSTYLLDAEISVDTDTYTATIRPYCTDSTGKTPIENVLLYIYRREYNGTFTLISGDIDNTSEFKSNGNGTYTIGLSNTFVTDPHPALDYARYRIVAVDKNNRSTMYSDIPAYPVGCKSIILQWGETWTDFDATDEDDENDTSSWSGEMLKLPYNIDITNKYAPDVALVKYIGREHPVDYYGTQRGESATWNTVIEKDDQETIYALYRLANYMGSVYVREPSGVGYRAHVKVSFGRKHRDLTVPVTLDITRVEGED